MKLIILLAVLGLERYLGIGEKIRRFCYFDVYLKQVDKIVGKQPWFKGIAGAVLTVLPIPLIALIICGLLSLIGGRAMGGFVWFFLSIAILLYCLGPEDIYKQVREYITAKKAGDSTRSTEIEKELLGDADSATKAEPHAVTGAIFWNASQSLFSVLFWFMLFGIFGALFYRGTVMLKHAAKEKNSPFADQYGAAEQIQNILDWIPVRIFTLFFALVGHFSAAFSFWLEHVLSGLDKNRQFISEGGVIALGTVKAEKETQHADEYHSALALIDRSLILFLAIVALSTLGSWIY
jgi:AmpE protein